MKIPNDHKRKSHKSKISRKNKSYRLKSFDVLFMATMSAGKTSFVNALIGSELLHTANEATTACLTSVAHCRGRRRFGAICFSHNDESLLSEAPASAATLRTWNLMPEVYRIELQGGFKSQPHPIPGLVLHDPPGPNNSQDERHAQLMLAAIHRIRYHAVCYVLNVSQLGTQDERVLLERLHQEFSSSGVPIYFILNKVDLLDPEHGESIAACIEKTKQYLFNIGFEKPIIVPAMASIALYAQLALLEEPLTRGQRLRLQQALNSLEYYLDYLVQASEIPDIIKSDLLRAMARIGRTQGDALEQSVQDRRRLQQLQLISGVKTVQALIKKQFQP